MSGYYDPIIAEVRRTREKLLEKYGGAEGYSKHLDETRPFWEARVGISRPRKNARRG
jgi:hypothetical protein